MAQRRDDVGYDTKHGVALSATISTPVPAAIHHRIVSTKSMFATESVHSQMVAVANYGFRSRRRLHVWGYRPTGIGHHGGDIKTCAVNGDRMHPIARPHRVVDHIVEHLAAIGVDYVFGVDGANIEDLYDAAYFRSDLTAILAKHEFSAATMADGYSRSGGGVGGDVRDIRGRVFEHSGGARGIASQPRAGACADRPGADQPRRAGRFSGHQRPQRRVERRGTVFGAVGVLPAGGESGRHRVGIAGSDRGGADGWPRGAAAAQEC